MTITHAAANVICEWLRASSGIAHPVIYLGVASETPPEVSQALQRGARRKELEEITLSAMKSGPKYLYPLVYPGSHFLWLTSTIGGFRFAARFFYRPHVRRAIKSGVLDAAEQGLVLKDADGTVVLPPSSAATP